MMNLVDKQNGFLPGSAHAIHSSSDDATHFGNVAFHAAQTHELRVRPVGNYVRERGFSCAGRTRKNYGWQTIGFDCTAQKFPRRENMFLADEFVERARTHARGERRCAVDLLGSVGLFPGK